MILSSSMMADVVEASQSETGRRSEGLFFAGYFFMQKCATGIGIFVAGMILSFAAFPASAKPGEVGDAVLGNLALGYALAVLVIGTLGLIVMRRFPISRADHRSEEHTSELQSLMRISYAVFCLKKKNQKAKKDTTNTKQPK